MAKLLPETGDVLAVPLATAMGVTCVGGAGLTKPPAGTGSAVTTAVCYVPHTHTHTLCNKRQLDSTCVSRICSRTWHKLAKTTCTSTRYAPRHFEDKRIDPRLEMISLARPRAVTGLL